MDLQQALENKKRERKRKAALPFWEKVAMVEDMIDSQNKSHRNVAE